MGELLTPTHLIVLAVVSGIFVIPVVMFTLTMQRTLNKCAPQSRTIDPGMVWLYVIPFVSTIFGFFLVMAITKSLRNEYARRGLVTNDIEFGQTLGIAMCACACAGYIPFLGILGVLAHLVLWIMYWVKISEYLGMLDAPAAWNPPAPPAQY